MSKKSKKNDLQYEGGVIIGSGCMMIGSLFQLPLTLTFLVIVIITTLHYHFTKER